MYMGTEGFVGGIMGDGREWELFRGTQVAFIWRKFCQYNASPSQPLPLQAPCFLTHKCLLRFAAILSQTQRAGETGKLELSCFLSVTQPVVTGNGIQIPQW